MGSGEMLVMNMNSKRQRRPNVRLGEIGDVPAAFACGFSQKTKGNFGGKRLKQESMNSYENELKVVKFEFPKQITPNCLVSEEHDVGPDVSLDLHQNRENKNPNSSKSVLGISSSDGFGIDTTKPALNFGTITRKSRVMRRRSQSKESNFSVSADAWTWHSNLSPRFSNEDRKAPREKEFAGITSNGYLDFSSDDGIIDLSDHETPATTCGDGTDEPAYADWQLKNAEEYRNEDVRYEESDEYLNSGEGSDQMRYSGDDVISVTTWLEDLGFSRYAGLFEMHEVDEQALPLLTLEDLKEIGIVAVGHRRKLYNAIQQLRGGDVSS